MCIPNSEVYYRRGLALKKIIPQAIRRDYTALLVVNEDRQTPSILYKLLSVGGDTKYVIRRIAVYNHVVKPQDWWTWSTW